MILWPTVFIFGCCLGDLALMRINETIDVVDIAGIEVAPDLLDTIHECWKLAYFWNPVVVPYVALVHILLLITIERTTKVPYRTKVPFLVRAYLLMQITATMETLVVVGNLLYNIELSQRIHIEVFPQFVRVLVAIYEVVNQHHLLGEILLLLVRQHLWCLIGNPHGGPAALLDGYVRIGIIVVNLHQPSARDILAIGFLVFLLHDIHAIFVHANSLGKEIEANIIAVEYHFQGFGIGCVCHTNHLAQLHANGIA